MPGYFTGRYYKHQKSGNTICFIIGKSKSGKFLQVITNNKVLQFSEHTAIQITGSSLTVNLPVVCGRVEYGAFTPLHSDIMGPFRFLPLQCRHEVVSLMHSLTGGFWVENQWLDLNNGTGYIEGDRGRSFPREYLWLHCNDFTESCSIMASVADIPLCGLHFRGCICAILHQGKEYRLATYHGVKIISASNKQLILQQGQLLLEVTIDARKAYPLQAPKAGLMTETIHECNCAAAQFRFWRGNKKLFDMQSSNCSFECNFSQSF